MAKVSHSTVFMCHTSPAFESCIWLDVIDSHTHTHARIEGGGRPAGLGAVADAGEGGRQTPPFLSARRRGGETLSVFLAVLLPSYQRLMPLVVVLLREGGRRTAFPSRLCCQSAIG